MAISKELSQFAPLLTINGGITSLNSNYSITGNLTVNGNTITLGTTGETIKYNPVSEKIELSAGLVVDSLTISGGASGSFDTGNILYSTNTIVGYNTNENISITANGTGRIVINNDLTLTGTTLRAPATFYIDPAAHGDDTGTVVIKGNLQVDGTTTTINSTTLTIDDRNIIVASGAADAAAANGAGITVDGANATFTYTSTNDQFELNKGLKLPLGVKVTKFSDDGSLAGNSDLAVPTERAVKTYVNDFQAATFEPTGFSRGAPNTMGVIEFSLDGTTVYSIDQNSNQTTRTDGKFATGTAWETAATPRTLAMYPASGQTSFINWQSGIKYTFTTLQKVSFTAGQQAAHYFFFDQGVLNSYTSITGEYIQKLPFVSEVYCDEATNTVVVFGEERHGITMDGATHLYLHGTTGTRYRSGLGISNFVAGATTYTSTAGGVIYDEDIAINIGTQSTNNMLYMIGTAWKLTPASNSFAYMVGGKAQYNPKVGGAYQLSDIPAGSYAVMYFMATNCRIHQTMKIMGQYVFTTLAEARESAQSEPRDTVLLGLPSPEFLYVGAVVVDSTGAVQTLDNGAVFVDLRLVNISAGTNSSSAAVVMTAQDSIYDNIGSGLSATNVQLALTELGQEKLDKAGGTMTGSLYIASGNLGVGTQSPATKLHVKGTWADGEGIFQIDTESVTQYSGLTIQNNGSVRTYFYDDNTNSLTFLGTVGNRSLVFATNTAGTDNERLRITNSGYVGVRTPTPLGRLSVLATAGNGWDGTNFVAQAPGSAQGQRACISFAPTFTNTADNVPRRTADILAGYNNGAWGYEYLAFHVGNNGASNDSNNLTSEKIRITSTGAVGIGTSSPGSTLHIINNSGNTQLRVYTASGTSASLEFSSDTYSFINIVGSGQFGIQQGGTERIRLDASGNLLPATDVTYSLGSLTKRWANIYTGDLHLSNESKGGNDVDGTTGNWTIQEGNEDLYIINNKTGKKYRFKLEEIQ